MGFRGISCDLSPIRRRVVRYKTLAGWFLDTNMCVGFPVNTSNKLNFKYCYHRDNQRVPLDSTQDLLGTHRWHRCAMVHAGYASQGLSTRNLVSWMIFTQIQK